jgi:hypothetical protein
MPRKRKPGARTKSGRLSRAYQGPARDVGTREGMAKRLALVNGSNNDSLAYTLPDILLAHGQITVDQHRAAWQLRRARAAVFGVPLANSAGGREPTEEQLRLNERKYERLMKLLTPDQALAVVDVALDLRTGWVRRAILKLPPADGDGADRRALVTGLDVLARA